MIARLRRLFDQIRAWLVRLPKGWLAALAFATVAVVSVAAVFMVRTYEFVEHDNEFCLSCHLMADPYERFAQSAHRGLGCKACHQPTFVERSRMALSQIIEQPEEIRTHAHVPNEACASCHIEGDPEQWRIIASSIGHRIHLESDDPALRGLMCVECHSTSIHAFAAADRTCAQAGCHEDTRIRLGRMEDLTIHCAACHEFSRPVADTVAAGIGLAQLRPGRSECLTCHAMRVLVSDMPEDEPHDRVCGACHDPHTQTTPREAERTCASVGCHVRPDTLSPMHQGLAVGVLEGCVTCHTAHDFRVRAERCLDCHANIYADEPRPLRPPGQTSALPPSHPPIAEKGGVRAHPSALGPHPPATSPRSPVREQRQAGRGGEVYQGRVAAFWASLGAHSAATASAAPVPSAQVPRQDPLVFSHSRHRGVACTACHSTERVHGALTVTSVRDCRSCHHTAPVANECSRCHQPAQLHAERTTVRQAMRLAVAPTRTRDLPFAHAAHVGVACTSCHREPLTLRANVACNACHQEHHRPATACMQCHTPSPRPEHTVNAHLGCAGSGCHEPAPFSGVPRTRNFCLVCHQDMVAHQPGGNCASCHRLPPPTQALLHEGAPLTATSAGGGR